MLKAVFLRFLGFFHNFFPCVHDSRLNRIGRFRVEIVQLSELNNTGLAEASKTALGVRQKFKGILEERICFIL